MTEFCPLCDLALDLPDGPVQPARWFVSQAGWGRRFTSRDAALAHAETLWRQ